MNTTRTLLILFVTLLIFQLGTCQNNTTNTTNSTAPPMNGTVNNTNGTMPPPTNWTNTTNGTMTNWTNMTMNGTNNTNGTWTPPMNYTNTTNNTMNPPMNNTNMTNGTWNPMNGTNMTNMTNGTWNPMNGTNMTNMTNGTWNPPMNYTNMTNGTWNPMNGTNMTNMTNGTWNPMNGTNMTNMTNGTYYPPMNGTNMTNGTWNPMNGTNMTNGTWNPPMNYTNMTNGTWNPMNGTNMTNMTNNTMPPMNGTNMTNGTWNPPMNGTNMTNMTNGTWNPPMNYTNMTNGTWNPMNGTNMTNMTNGTWNPPMNYTNMTNGTWNPMNGTNMTNMTNGTYYPPMNNTNMTNMTNGTWNPPMNYTNMTNGTWNPMNGTNMTNGTWNPMNGTNMTNMTNGTWNPPMNGTNMTNGTWNPPMNGTNMTNMTNGTYYPPMNNTNMTNNTMPPMNGTNMTNMTNGTWYPPMNGTNMTNMTNGTYYLPMNGTNMTNNTMPPMNGTNMTNMTNNSMPPMNGTNMTNNTMPPMNGTNMTNGTWNPPMNGTNMTNMTNGTYYPPMNNTNMTNNTMPPMNGTNMTNMTNGTWNPPMNYTNMTNMTNGTWNPPMNYTNMTNNTMPPMNGTNMTNMTNNTMPPMNGTNMTNMTNNTMPPMNGTNMTNMTNNTMPPMNGTNMTNNTMPPMNNTNMTNMTNNTMPPMNGTNMTNMTNNTMPPMNGTNMTNNTVPPMNNTNTTNNTGPQLPPPPTPTFNTTNYTTNSTQSLAFSGFTINQNLTMATPPPITSAGLASLYYSDNENLFLGSTQPQSLRLLQGQGSTLFNLDVFNRSQTSFISTYSITSSGLWNFVTSNADRLTCSMVHNPVAGNVSFLFFDEYFGDFTVKANLLQSTLPSPLNSLNLTELGNIKVGQNCDLIRYQNRVFSFDVNGVYNTSGLGNTIQASSSDLVYVISNNVLFKKDFTSNVYNQLASLIPYTNYWVKSSFNNIIAWGSSSINGSTVNQTVYAMLDSNIFHQDTFVAYSVTGNSVPVQYSPYLSKISYQYRTSNNSLNLNFFDLDFYTPASYTITLVNPSAYLQTMANVSPLSLSNFCLGDYYLAVQNASAHNGAGIAVQSTFQFIGSELIPLRVRDISATDIVTPIYMVYIDQYFINTLIVLDLYYNGDTNYPGYDIYEYTYGNLAQTIRVIPPPPSEYINIPLPTSTSTTESPNRLSLDIMDVNTNSIYYRYQENQNVTGHVQIDTINLAGIWTWKASSANDACQLFSSTSGEFRVYQIANNGTVSSPNIISSLLSGVVTTTWHISNDCMKIKTDANVYSAPSLSGTFAQVGSVTSWLAFDDNLDYALTTNSILKYNPSSPGYTSIHTFNITFTANSAIYSYNSRVVVTDVSASSSSAYALVGNNNNNSLAVVLTHSQTGYDSQPTVLVSSQCTKVLAYGIVSSAFSSSFYFVDYAFFSWNQITFPAFSVFDPTAITIMLQQNWIYVRQMPSSQPAGQNLQYAFSILLNTLPEVADFRNITVTAQSSYSATYLRVLHNGTLYVLNKQTLNSSRLVATLWQINMGETIEFQTNSDLGISQYVVDGQVTLCAPGCSDCSTGVCTACSSGYSFDTNAGICYICGFGCTFCSSTDPNSCTACYDGFYLSGTTCLECDISCITCSGTATSCQNCLPGHYFDGSACATCPRNCLNCTNNGTCTACRNGFVVTGNGTCRGCSRSCSSCQVTNITACTSCAQYLQLVSGSCQPCPSRCKRCSAGLCAKCDKGYHPSADSTSCVQNCLLPCKKCQDGFPSVCTACYRGSVLNGSTCSLDMACNLDNSCTDCGQGTGYVLVGANCKTCPTLANCKQCSQTNLRACAICNPGYWVNGTSCTLCPTQCTTCLSNSSCTGCSPGYTLPNEITQGSCVACASPCLTCHGSDNYCTSCITGYTKTNWKCQSNINIGFSFTLNANSTAVVLNLIDELVTWLLTGMNADPTLVDLITFTSIQLGSVVVTGTGTTPTGSSSSTSSSSSALSSTLTSGSTVAGLSVGSSSVVANGVETTSDDSNNMGMIIGLAVGIPIAIILIIIIVYICYKRNRKVDENTVDKQYESNVVFGGTNPSQLVQKQGGANLELELPDVSSEESMSNKNNKITEKEDGFSEYVQATVNAPIYQPAEEQEFGEFSSPSPIVIKDLPQNSGNDGIRDYQSQPQPQKSGQPVRFKAGQEIIKVHPVPTNKGKMEIFDNTDFVQSKKKIEKKAIEDDEFGQFHQVTTIPKPMAEIQIPDEDEFGEIVSETPARHPLTTNDLQKPMSKTEELKKIEPIVMSTVKPALFEIEIEDSESENGRGEKQSEDSRY